MTANPPVVYRAGLAKMPTQAIPTTMPIASTLRLAVLAQATILSALHPESDTDAGHRNSEADKMRAREHLTLARDQARECLELGDYAMSDEAYSACLKLTPADDELYNQRARVRLLTGRAIEAEEDARHATHLSPYSPRGHYRLARTLCSQQRLVEAGEEFVEARRLGDEHYWRVEDSMTELMGGIHRDREYTDKREQRGDDWRVGVDAGRLRFRLLSTTPPPNQTPLPAVHPGLHATDSTVTLMLHECTHDGNDDIYCELQLVMVDPLTLMRTRASLRQSTGSRPRLRVPGQPTAAEPQSSTKGSRTLDGGLVDCSARGGQSRIRARDSQP